MDTTIRAPGLIIVHKNRYAWAAVPPLVPNLPPLCPKKAKAVGILSTTSPVGCRVVFKNVGSQIVHPILL